MLSGAQRRQVAQTMEGGQNEEIQGWAALDFEIDLLIEDSMIPVNS